MEWLGILLLYLISGFMKKREQNQKHKEIESEPGWDSDDSTVIEKPETNLDQLLNDLPMHATTITTITSINVIIIIVLNFVE